MISTFRMVYFHPDRSSGTRLPLGALVEHEGKVHRVRQSSPWWLCALTGKTRKLAEHMHEAMAFDSIDMSTVSRFVSVEEKPRALNHPNPVSFVYSKIVNAFLPPLEPIESKAIPDIYGNAANLAGVTRDAILRDRSQAPMCARWGVWLALHAKGWGAQAIAKRSAPDRKWDHSTVNNAISRAPALADRHKRGLIKASHIATMELLEEESE